MRTKWEGVLSSRFDNHHPHHPIMTIITIHDGLSNLGTELYASLCTDSVVVGKNESFIIMSRIMCDKLKIIQLLQFSYKTTSTGLNWRAVFEAWASECECIVKPFTVKYNSIPDLSMMSDTMDYSFLWEFILSKNPKIFIQKFQDILMKTLSANSTKDTWFSFFLSLSLALYFAELKQWIVFVLFHFFLLQTFKFEQEYAEQKVYSTCVVYCV